MDIASFLMVIAASSLAPSKPYPKTEDSICVRYGRVLQYGSCFFLAAPINSFNKQQILVGRGQKTRQKSSLKLVEWNSFTSVRIVGAAFASVVERGP